MQISQIQISQIKILEVSNTEQLNAAIIKSDKNIIIQINPGI